MPFANKTREKDNFVKKPKKVVFYELSGKGYKKR